MFNHSPRTNVFPPSPLSPRDPNSQGFPSSAKLGALGMSKSPKPATIEFANPAHSTEDNENVPVGLSEPGGLTADTAKSTERSTSPMKDPRTSSTPRPRGSKYASLLRQRDPALERERRKSAYLSGVRERGDHKRWEARDESSLQRDFFDEQRAWEAERAREAPAWTEEIENADAADTDMDEDLPDLHDHERYDGAGTQPHRMGQPEPSSDFGGEECEGLLLEAVHMAEVRTQSDGPATGGSNGDVAMG